MITTPENSYARNRQRCKKHYLIHNRPARDAWTARRAAARAAARAAKKGSQ